MTDREYFDAIQRSAEIAGIITADMDEEKQELFEEYCELQLAMLKTDLIR